MKLLKSYMIKGIIFVSLLGTLLHFAYSLSGNNILVGLFTPVNESVWEHTKLIFFPFLLYALYPGNKLKSLYPSITSGMIVGAFSGILFITSLFYTYSGILGFNVAIIDILTFYISVVLSFLTAYKLTISGKMEKYTSLLKILSIILIFVYILFTFQPPQINLFAEP